MDPRRAHLNWRNIEQPVTGAGAGAGTGGQYRYSQRRTHVACASDAEPPDPWHETKRNTFQTLTSYFFTCALRREHFSRKSALLARPILHAACRIPRCGTGATCALPRAVAALPLADLGPMRWAGARALGRGRCGGRRRRRLWRAALCTHCALTDAEKSCPRKSLGIQSFLNVYGLPTTQISDFARPRCANSGLPLFLPARRSKGSHLS